MLKSLGNLEQDILIWWSKPTLLQSVKESCEFQWDLEKIFCFLNLSGARGVDGWKINYSDTQDHFFSNLLLGPTYITYLLASGRRAVTLTSYYRWHQCSVQYILILFTHFQKPENFYHHGRFYCFDPMKCFYLVCVEYYVGRIYTSEIIQSERD